MFIEVLDSTVTFLTKDWTSSSSLVRTIVIPISSAGFGALSGGWFAYRLRVREGLQHRNLESLKRLQLTALTASTICNTAIGLKKQYVRDLVRDYRSQRTLALNVLGTPTVRKEINVSYDFFSIVCPVFPTKELDAEVRSITGKDGSFLLQMSALSESVENLRTVINQRNAWMLDFEAKKKAMSEQEAANRFLGIPLSQTETDLRYFHLMEQLEDTLDAIIFHSMHIYYRTTKRLFKESEEYRLKYGEQFNFQIITFFDAASKFLFPDAEKFKDWLIAPENLKKPWSLSRKRWRKQLGDRIDEGTGRLFSR